MPVCLCCANNLVHSIQHTCEAHIGVYITAGQRKNLYANSVKGKRSEGLRGGGGGREEKKRRK